MSKSKIEWCDEHWEPVGGCRRKSDGCRHCYAERMVAQLAGVYPGRGRPNKRYAALTVLKSGEPHFTGKIEMWPDRLVEPLRWRKTRTVFVCSQSDLFYEKRPFEHIAAVYAVMAATPHIKYLVLTKRPERRREFFAWLSSCGPAAREVLQLCFLQCHGGFRWLSKEQRHAVDTCPWPLPNVGEGVSVEDQPTADDRIPVLLGTPAAMRFVSYEPALAAVDCSRWLLRHATDETGDCASWCRACGPQGPRPGIDWIIAGAESGPGARPADLEWFRSVRDQCAAAGVAYFLKQADVCEDCSGDGFARGSTNWRGAPVTCSYCNGTGRAGKVRKGNPALDGQVHDARPAWLTGGEQ